MLGNARNAGGYWEMLENPGECRVMLGSAGGAAECWGGIVGGMLGNAVECWGMLGSVGCWGILGENARGMLGECWGILGNARECWGGCFFPQVFLQCMRVGQLEPQNKNALPVPLLRQVSWRPFF